MTREELVQKYGSIANAAKALGILPATLRSRLKNHGTHEAKLNKGGNDVIQTSFGKNLDEFRNKYDKSYTVPLKIQEALKKLGPDNWEYEIGFAKLAGIGVADLSTFREKFSEYVVTVHREQRKVWAGSTQMAEKMRKLLS